MFQVCTKNIVRQVEARKQKKRATLHPEISQAFKSFANCADSWFGVIVGWSRFFTEEKIAFVFTREIPWFHPLSLSLVTDRPGHSTPYFAKSELLMMMLVAGYRRADEGLKVKSAQQRWWWVEIEACLLLNIRREFLRKLAWQGWRK